MISVRELQAQISFTVKGQRIKDDLLLYLLLNKEYIEKMKAKCLFVIAKSASMFENEAQSSISSSPNFVSDVGQNAITFLSIINWQQKSVNFLLLERLIAFQFFYFVQKFPPPASGTIQSYLQLIVGTLTSNISFYINSEL